MCNNKHEEFESIRKNGKGWKLVNTDPLGDYVALVCRERYFKTDGWVVWNTLYRGDGFCFFTNKKVAQRALKVWTRSLIKPTEREKLIPIVYKEGVCKQIETGFCGNTEWPIALCKKWKPTEEK